MKKAFLMIMVAAAALWGCTGRSVTAAPGEAPVFTEVVRH